MNSSNSNNSSVINNVILNLTQHPATPEQIAKGVLDLKEGALEELKRLLTFKELPSRAEIKGRALEIAQLVPQIFNCAMIGGAPFLMADLHNTLLDFGIRPVYAFSERVSVETLDQHWNVIKTSQFVHRGFVNLID